MQDLTEWRLAAQSAVEGIAVLLEVAYVSLHFLKEETQELECLANWGWAEGRRDPTPCLRMGEGLTGRVAQTARPLLLVDLTAEPGVESAGLRDSGLQSYAGVPLTVNGRVVGTLAVFDTRRGTLSSHTLERLTAAACLLALSLPAGQGRDASPPAAGAEEGTTALAGHEEQLIATERLKALGEMAHGVAHNFNDILSIMLGNLQLVAREVVDRTHLLERLKAMEAAAHRGVEIVRRIQDFTRTSQERSEEVVNLRTAVQEALELTRPLWKTQAEALGISYTIRNDVDDVFVRCPVSACSDMLVNLLHNAFEVMPRGGAVTLASRIRDDMGVLVVADEGYGMTEAVKSRIFEPFFTTKGPAGTGLGLSTVYGLLQRQGGRIQVESQVGRGTTFLIELPLASNPQALGKGKRSAHHLTGTILLIDDEAAVREVLQAFMEMDGHRVLTAPNGAAGLALYRAREVDLVLCDLAMPGMNGWAVAEAIRDHNRAHGRQVPFIFLTGWPVNIAPEQLQQAGVDYVLAKTVGFEEKSRVIQEALLLKRAAS